MRHNVGDASAPFMDCWVHQEFGPQAGFPLSQPPLSLYRTSCSFLVTWVQLFTCTPNCLTGVHSCQVLVLFPSCLPGHFCLSSCSFLNSSVSYWPSSYLRVFSIAMWNPILVMHQYHLPAQADVIEACHDKGFVVTEGTVCANCLQIHIGTI